MKFNLFLVSGFLNKNFFKFNRFNRSNIDKIELIDNGSKELTKDLKFNLQDDNKMNNQISKLELDNNNNNNNNKLEDLDLLYDLSWYVIGESNSFNKNKPYKITVWDHDYVIWKDDNNTYFAMDNHCSHRGAPLSNGRLLKNGNIMCGYHGYEFNNSGVLCKVPGLNFTSNPCKNQKSYNIVEQDNLIYLNTFGKTSNNFNRNNIFQEPEAINSSFRKIMLEFNFNAYGRVISENSLDVMHIGFVHTFGNRENPSPIKEIPPYLVKDENNTNNIFHYRTEYLYQSGKNSMAKTVFKSDKLTIQNEFILPHTTVARVIFGNYISTVITNVLPINNTHSKLFVKTYRNFWCSASSDLRSFNINTIGDLITRNMMYNTVLQDKGIIENIKLKYIDGRFNLKYDKLQNVYRAFYKKYVKDISKL